MAIINSIREVDQIGISNSNFSKHLADCVILTHDNKILMQQRPMNWRTHPGVLNIFGGHVENGEPILDALKRELHEELGAQVNSEDIVFIAAITEDETNHTKLIHVHFWHDRQATITGCYEAEAKRFDNIDAALAHPKTMDYARWALLKCHERGLV